MAAEAEPVAEGAVDILASDQGDKKRADGEGLRSQLTHLSLRKEWGVKHKIAFPSSYLCDSRTPEDRGLSYVL